MNFNQSNTFPSIIAGDAYVDRLFINGIRFRDVVASLISEDVLEQQEIEDLRTILLYLDTSALTQPWVVDNNNRNATLKTLITAIETKLNFIDTTALSQSSVLNNDNRNSVLKTAIDGILTKLTYIDTTALTQSSVLTNDNRNSVLKTRIDGNDGSLTDLTNKTRYIQQSTVGNNSTDPKTANILSINVNSNPSGIHKGDLSIQAGFNLIRMKNNSTTLQDINYNDNQMVIMSPNGMISSDAHLNRIMASDKIEIGNINTQSSIAINIGGKGSQINIGSIDDPAVGQTNTIITIGKRTDLKNTETYHKGNQYIAEARWEDLPISTGITLQNIYALLSGSAPSYILGAFVATAGGFNYSDILHMNLSNPLQKNKDITTSKGITLETLKIFDNSAISIFPKISTYFVNGDIVSTQVVGQNITSVYSGKIKLENHNTLNPLNINWAFSQDDDNVNVLDIKGDEGIFIHQGASQVNQPLRILNSCGSGGIELKVGGSSTEPANRGRKQHAVGGLFLRQSNQLSCAITKQPPDETIFGFKRKTNNNNAKVDYRLLVSCNDDEPSNIPLNNGAQQNHGIVVYNEAKHQAIDNAAIATGTQPVYTEYTAIDEDNITTPSLSFLGTYAGPTTKTLYTNANSDLMYDGQPVAVGSIAASGGGLTYVITNPATATITTPNFTPITNLTMSSTYTSAPLRTVTLSNYNNNTNYKLVEINGIIQSSTNPILSGTYELNQYINNSVSVASSIYAKLYFTGLGTFILSKQYTSPAGSGDTSILSTPEIKVPLNNVSITIAAVSFPSVFVGGASFGFSNLVLTLVNQSSTILYTFPTVTAPNQTTAIRVFSPASPVTITQTANISSLRFSLTNQNQTSTLNQASALNATNANYNVEGSSIKILLYDGTTNPTALTPNAQTIYPLSIPLPATPFIITDFVNPYITLEEWFIQPSGSTNNHTVALQFNDGGLSHLHTSLASQPSIPPLATVMQYGNSVGSSPLNMNNQSIQNCNTITATTVTPTTITGWSVKTLSEGAGITITNINGNHTINNAGITPTISQVLQQGNNANTQSLSGINVLTATTIVPTHGITGWNVKEISSGPGISISNTSGNYTISANTSGNYLSSSDDYAITATTPTSQKPFWYGQSWGKIDFTNSAVDIYMSSNGRYIAVATRGINLTPTGIFYSTNYGETFATSGVTKLWRSISGTTTGDAIYAVSGGTDENGNPYTREIYKSINYGANWTKQTDPPDFAASNPNRIRVSGDGKYQLINDGRTNGLGKLYKSNNYGTTWTTQNLTTATGTVNSMYMSSSGQVQYVEISGTSEGLLTDTGSGGIYRSIDFGSNWTRVNITDPIWHMSCDATGRIVAASTNTGLITSRDYGTTWSIISMTGATAVSVSASGNIIWVGCINQAINAQLYFSDDYGQNFVVRNTSPLGSYISTSYTTIATNTDGSIVIGGSSSYLNRYRIIPNELTNITAGSNIAISRIENGSYQISSTITAVNDYQLWANGSIYVPYDGVTSNFILDWNSFGKIDLVAYDIKYEIEIHWDANTSTTTAWPFAFIEMGLNKVMSIDNLNQGIISQTTTNWTNLINNGTFGSATEYNQSYFGRFFAGFSQNNNPVGANNPAFRYKTLLSGYLNYNYRFTSQTGITDNSLAGRLIQNHFTCDSFLQQNTGFNTWGIWMDGSANDAHLHRIHGSSLWDTSMNNNFTANSGTNEALSQGIYRIVLRLHEGSNFLTLRPRGGQIVYRIYRIKK